MEMATVGHINETEILQYVSFQLNSAPTLLIFVLSNMYSCTSTTCIEEYGLTLVSIMAML